MKKINYLLAMILLISITIEAQDVNGKVFYEKSISLNKNRYDDNYQMSEEQKTQLMEMSDRNLKFKSVLQFNASKSIYKEEVILNNREKSLDGKLRIINKSKPQIFYHDYEKNELLYNKQVFDEYYLIKDELLENNWELKKETKEVVGYTCYKAVKKDDENTYTVWYTKEIKSNAGPEEYYGLPGLILEVIINDESGKKTTITCLKVELSENKILFEKPEGDSVVQRDEFDKIMKEKVEEYMASPIEGERKLIKIGG